LQIETLTKMHSHYKLQFDSSDSESYFFTDDGVANFLLLEDISRGFWWASRPL